MHILGIHLRVACPNASFCHPPRSHIVKAITVECSKQLDILHSLSLKGSPSPFSKYMYIDNSYHLGYEYTLIEFMM